MSGGIIYLTLRIEPEQAGTYFTLSFDLPEGVERLTLRYDYERFIAEDESDGFTAWREANLIDLGLIDPHGRQVGASGSDKREVFISETRATPGYHPWRLEAGEWRILVGAYHVAPEGVTVYYEVEYEEKQLRLLKGDLHTHTLASDGVLTAEELAWRAARHGLDFLAITDHNQMVSADALPRVPGVTLIPGIEWTHFRGHANFLGVDRPYDEPFFANTLEEIRARFESARQRGALIMLNHPFEEACPFQFPLEELPFDCLEIWNGPMRESNLRAVGLWQGLLAQGKKIPAVGGSDYHRDTPFIFLGGPTTCVWAMSNSPADILEALKQGHSYLTFAPNGPELEFDEGETLPGDMLDLARARGLQVRAGGLLAGDVVRLVTAAGADVLLRASENGQFHGRYAPERSGFARVEVLRAFLPGLPLLPALISNPVYFEG